ncbi:hypothetical protein Hanom_Chr10g00889031 [Helianthus anomalus]
MDGVNEPHENGKILNLLDPDVKKQTFGGKSQSWPNLKSLNRKKQTKKKATKSTSVIRSSSSMLASSS